MIYSNGFQDSSNHGRFFERNVIIAKSRIFKKYITIEYTTNDGDRYLAVFCKKSNDHYIHPITMGYWSCIAYGSHYIIRIDNYLTYHHHTDLEDIQQTFDQKDLIHVIDQNVRKNIEYGSRLFIDPMIFSDASKRYCDIWLHIT